MAGEVAVRARAPALAWHGTHTHWEPVAMSQTPDPAERAARTEGPSDEHTFTAQLWLWDSRKQDTWTFVTLPKGISAALEEEAAASGPRAGFGSVRVSARIDSCTWRTSVFPDAASGCYVLPIKRSVRDSVGIDVGDVATVHLHQI